ncbi:tail length tape measure protein, partial [Staphylococcus haemolyticus]
YLIGQPDTQEAAIAQFPSHPLTWEIIRKRLDENPNQPKLQLILAKYTFDQPGIISVLDQLVSNSKDPTQVQAQSSLKPEDWEIIGTAYWENNEFTKAAAAYAKAAKTPRNLYRTARGLQVRGQKEQAQAIYQQLVQQFPDATQTGTALMRQAEMVKSKDALPYLD